jgi:phosphoribosyl 1,2-cyclic phosphodiesterase
MKISVLGSGSGGNAVLIETGDSRVLVDAGFKPRVIAQRLRAIGVAPESVQAVIVTHEHTDHAKGVAGCVEKWNWAVYATAGTRMMCSDWLGFPIQIVEKNSTFTVGNLQVQTIPVSHDATEPIGLVVTHSASGARAGIVYDLGYVSEGILAALKDLEVLILEANHDEHMLRAGPYPFMVQARIGGRMVHLSNRAAAAAAVECVHPGLKHIVLAHLSENCNEPKVALKTVGDALRRTRFKGRLTTSAQHVAAGPFFVGTDEVGRYPAQLALQL